MCQRKAVAHGTFVRADGIRVGANVDVGELIGTIQRLGPGIDYVAKCKGKISQLHPHNAPINQYDLVYDVTQPIPV